MSLGLRFIRVLRPESDRLAFVKEMYPDTWETIINHPSETSLDEFQEGEIIKAPSVAV